jgi:hypothetical protein
MVSTQDVKQYFSNISKGKVIPKDPFSLSYVMLSDEDEDVLNNDLATKHVQLAYLGNDRIVRLFQNDVEILTVLRNMAMRDTRLFPFFETLYHSWIGTVKVTKAKDGAERQLQASAVGAYSPSSAELSGGFGEYQPQQEEQKGESPIKPLSNFLKRIAERRRGFRESMNTKK